MLRSELVITVIMIVEERMPGIEVWRRGGGGVPRRFSQI
jgi:hypothetical protein